MRLDRRSGPRKWSRSRNAILLVNLDRNAMALFCLRSLSPLGWDHINLAGDDTWPRQSDRFRKIQSAGTRI